MKNKIYIKGNILKLIDDTPLAFDRCVKKGNDLKLYNGDTVVANLHECNMPKITFSKGLIIEDAQTIGADIESTVMQVAALAEPPSDDRFYAKQNGEWVDITDKLK